MMNKLLRIFVCIFLIGLMLIPAVLSAGASSASDVLKQLYGVDISMNFDYLNVSTENRVCVIDDDQLIKNRDALVDVMKPLTEYGTVIFWSCSVSEETQNKQVDEWQDGEYAKDSCILVINLERGYLNFYSSGAVYRAVGEDELQAINDAIISYASEGDYDKCAKEGFSAVYEKLSGESIPQPTEAVKTPSSDKEAVRYENPETGYEVMILDDADLLSDIEESMLADQMKPITDYGHIVFWSTNERASDAEIQAREKRASYYARSSAGILSINMSNRKVVFHSDGAINDAVDASYARSITDNASGYASSGDYYSCAKETFSEVNMILHGQAIAEPMKYTSFIVIALMIAFVVVVGLAFGKFNPLNKTNRRQVKLVGSGQLTADQPLVRKTGSEQRGWITALWFILSLFFSGGGSSGSSGSGGGGGGGSSGGGSGGSSSF